MGKIRSSRMLDTKFGLSFIVHQVLALWVVTISAPVVSAPVFNMLRMAGWTGASGAYKWTTQGNPWFPADACLALILGWVLCGFLRNRSMLWIWVLPTLALAYALAAVPTGTPRIVPAAFQAGIGQSRFVHYFGRGCAVGNYCLDQSTFTRPFLIGICYSLGALLVLKTPLHFNRRSNAYPWIGVTAGALILAATSEDLILAARLAGWHWSYLILAGVPAATGGFLVLLSMARMRFMATARVKKDFANRVAD
jgi:hypothetical protein